MIELKEEQRLTRKASRKNKKTESASRKIILQELEEIEDGPIENGIVVNPLDDDVFLWEAIISGPKHTPYERGLFQLQIEIPEDYPESPPVFRFDTKIYHCNVSPQDGSIRCGLLEAIHSSYNDELQGHDSFLHFAPTDFTIGSLLLAIRELLAEPDLYNFCQPEIAIELVSNRERHDSMAREWTKKYAICFDENASFMSLSHHSRGSSISSSLHSKLLALQNESLLTKLPQEQQQQQNDKEKKQKKKKKVRFSKKKHIKKIPHISDLSDKIKKTCWYASDDYDDMKESFQYLLFILDCGESEKSATCLIDNEEETTCGLEYRTFQGAAERAENRQQAYDAVFDEQARQWKHKFNDDGVEKEHDNAVELARLYQNASHVCLAKAVALGKSQEDDIQEYLRDTRALETLRIKAIQQQQQSNSKKKKQERQRRTKVQQPSKSLSSRSIQKCVSQRDAQQPLNKLDDNIVYLMPSVLRV